jgi:hypothetical protein
VALQPIPGLGLLKKILSISACHEHSASHKVRQIQAIGSPPFGQHPRFTAVEQDWADQGLVNGEFCLLPNQATGFQFLKISSKIGFQNR